MSTLGYEGLFKHFRAGRRPLRDLLWQGRAVALRHGQRHGRMGSLKIGGRQ